MLRMPVVFRGGGHQYQAGVEDYPASSGGWLKLGLGVLMGVGVRTFGGMAFLQPAPLQRQVRLAALIARD